VRDSRHRSCPSSDRPLIPETCRFRLHDAADHVTVEVSGEIDLANAAQLEHGLVAAQPLDAGRLVLVDAAGVTFIDASGLNALLRAQSFARHHDGDVSVVNPSAPVQRLLEITGLDAQLLGSGNDHRDR
jgi:anti-anti-sigma factor